MLLCGLEASGERHRCPLMKKKKGNLQSRYCYQVPCVATFIVAYKATDGLLAHAAYTTILAKITKMGYSQDDNNYDVYLWPASVPVTYFSNHSFSQSVWLKLRSAPEKRVYEIYIKLDIAWSLFLNQLRRYLTPVSVHLYLTFVLTVYFIHCSWLHKKVRLGKFKHQNIKLAALSA